MRHREPKAFKSPAQARNPTQTIGSYRDNGKEYGNYYIIIGNEGIYWNYIGMMEKNMETTTL